jgi:hypothetical protein
MQSITVAVLCSYCLYAHAIAQTTAESAPTAKTGTPVYTKFRSGGIKLANEAGVCMYLLVDENQRPALYPAISFGYSKLSELSPQVATKFWKGRAVDQAHISVEFSGYCPATGRREIFPVDLQFSNGKCSRFKISKATVCNDSWFDADKVPWTVPRDGPLTLPADIDCVDGPSDSTDCSIGAKDESYMRGAHQPMNAHPQTITRL